LNIQVVPHRPKMGYTDYSLKKQVLKGIEAIQSPNTSFANYAKIELQLRLLFEIAFILLLFYFFERMRGFSDFKLLPFNFFI